MNDKTFSIIVRRETHKIIPHIVPLPAGHESFVRIVTSAGALSAGVPDSHKKTLRALCAFAVQSFSGDQSAAGNLEFASNDQYCWLMNFDSLSTNN